eukprot:4107481-Alexandrium_andersonii.AAC.1
MLVVGSRWPLREIKVSHATLRDVSVEGAEARVCLPASETDPRAEGARRAHLCACGGLQGAPAAV